MAYELRQIAKEITIAAIPHLRFTSTEKKSHAEHNQDAAEQIGKVYEIIFKSVARADKN